MVPKPSHFTPRPPPGNEVFKVNYCVEQGVVLKKFFLIFFQVDEKNIFFQI